MARYAQNLRPELVVLISTKSQGEDEIPDGAMNNMIIHTYAYFFYRNFL